MESLVWGVARGEIVTKGSIEDEGGVYFGVEMEKFCGWSVEESVYSGLGSVIWDGCSGNDETMRKGKGINISMNEWEWRRYN